MEFLKKHYEKVILSVVLLGLAVAVALLPIMVSREKSALDDVLKGIITTRPKELKPLDLATNEASLKRVAKSDPVLLAGGHNLFNPVQWQKRPDGTIFPIRTGKEVGPSALTVTKVTPLYLKVEFDGVAGSEESPQYRFKVVREAAKTASQRASTTRSMAGAGSRNDIFILRELRPARNPVEFVLELVDSKDQITVRKDKPFSQIAGYMIDLRYEPEKLSFVNRRVGDTLAFAGDSNKIVAITGTNVTVAATSNSKRTTIPYRPVP